MFGIWFEKELPLTKEDVEGKAFVEYSSGGFLSTSHVRVERLIALKTSKSTEVAQKCSLRVDSALNATAKLCSTTGYWTDSQVTEI